MSNGLPLVFGDRVLIEIETVPETGLILPSGVIVPSTVNLDEGDTSPKVGTILALGDSEELKNSENIKVGLQVIYGRYGYDTLKFMDRTFHFVARTHLIGGFPKEEGDNGGD